MATIAFYHDMNDALPVDLVCLWPWIARQYLIKLFKDTLQIFGGDVSGTVRIARFESARLRQTSECGVVKGD